MTFGSNGSKVSSPPIFCGLPKSTDSTVRTPHGRSVFAIRTISGKKSGARMRGFTLTLLIDAPLIPSDASIRP